MLLGSRKKKICYKIKGERKIQDTPLHVPELISSYLTASTWKTIIGHIKCIHAFKILCGWALTFQASLTQKEVKLPVTVPVTYAPTLSYWITLHSKNPGFYRTLLHKRAQWQLLNSDSNNRRWTRSSACFAFLFFTLKETLSTSVYLKCILQVSALQQGPSQREAPVGEDDKRTEGKESGQKLLWKVRTIFLGSGEYLM